MELLVTDMPWANTSTPYVIVMWTFDSSYLQLKLCQKYSLQCVGLLECRSSQCTPGSGSSSLQGLAHWGASWLSPPSWSPQLSAVHYILCASRIGKKRRMKRRRNDKIRTMWHTLTDTVTLSPFLGAWKRQSLRFWVHKTYTTTSEPLALFQGLIKWVRNEATEFSDTQ